MAVVSGSLQSKITRAVRAYLLSVGAGSSSDTFSWPDSGSRTLPVTSIACGDLDELVLFSGNWRGQVTLTLHDSAAIQPEETTPQAARVAAESRLTLIYDALNIDPADILAKGYAIHTAARSLATSDGSDDGDQRALDDADLAELTFISWRPMGATNPTLSEDGTYWTRELTYDVIACNSALT